VGGAQGDRATFERSADFIRDVWKHNGSASEMHIGDLCWGVFHRSPPALASLRLWSVGTESPQALTMYDGNRVCDLVVRPGEAGVQSAELALDWAEAKCRGASPEADRVDFRVGRRVHQQPVRQLLVERGFVPLSTGSLAMHRTIGVDEIGDPVVPAGYHLRQLQDDELDERVRAFVAAFPDDELSNEAYRRLRHCAAYRPSLDVVVGAPDGTVAAFATLWFDSSNSVVQIEPAGCHPEHRRLGLTRAAILHALAAAARLGASDALVRPRSENGAAQKLYGSCGFQVASEHFGFVKSIDLTT
jgi:ribosomal protein S18 acetylase RimI-like enzyme